jgi:hypothetical protein
MNNVFIAVLVDKTKSSFIQTVSLIAFLQFFSTLTMRGIN